MMSPPLLAVWSLSPNAQLAAWTIAAGILSSVTCAILGCYLVLRRMSLLGDAISHAVLPGLVVAVLATGRLDGWPVFVGAVLMGVICAWLSQALADWGDVAEDSSLGVVFTSLFALGVVLLTQYASHVDLDPGCILYGLIEFIPVDTVPWLGIEVPRAIFTLSGVAVLTAVFVAVFWKELKLVSFDPALATAVGISAGLMHYLLMTMLAIVTVASFEAVGSILVIAMLIVPPATGHLLSDRLLGMMGWSIVCSIIAAAGGYYSAAAWNTSIAGMMAVIAGALFAAAVIFSPRHGLLTRLIRNLSWTLRIVQEDVLAVLYRAEEVRSQHPEITITWADCLELVGYHRWGRAAISLLRWRQLVTDDAQGRPVLTERGRRRAQSLVRSHRLWEAFLEKHFDLPSDHLHAPASRVEHYLGPELQQELAQELQTPQQDPHGRTIPPGSADSATTGPPDSTG